MNINKNIFRKNDIRGVYEKELTDDNAYQIGKAFGTVLQRNSINKCVVGHDNRLSSENLTNNLLQGIKETGVNIYYLGLVTTPMFNFATYNLNTPSGIMVTASHNPKNENGFKLFFHDYDHSASDEIQKFYNVVISNNFNSGNGSITNVNVENDYVNMLKNKIKLGNRHLKVVVDCGNAAASVIAKQVFSSFDIDSFILFGESDPNFPNHHPDPNVESNLSFLKQKVIETNADLGIAFDGDADRIGVVDENGKLIETDKLMIIFIRNICNKLKNKNIVLDIKCSKTLEDEIIKLNLIPVWVQNGSAYLENYIKHHNYEFGGEYSGHIFFRDNYYGYDDGIYAGLRLIEILSNTNQKTSELLHDINHYFNTPEIKIPCPDDYKETLVNKIKEYVISKNYNYLDIDGVRVNYPDGWALVRASNTGPNLTARFEATTQERCLDIKNEFFTEIEKNKIN